MITPALPRRIKTSMESWISVGVCIVCVAFGVGMERYYDWTGSDQSRPSPLVPLTALTILLIDAVMVSILIVRHFRDRSTHVVEAANRFGIRHILVATALTAIFAASTKVTCPPAVSVILTVAVLIALITWAVRVVALRARLGILLICTFSPYVWLLFPVWKGSLSNWLLLVPSLAMFLPSMVLNSLLGFRLDDNPLTLSLLSSTGLVLSTWLCAQSPRRAALAHIAMGTQSLFGSFVLHALMRM